MNRDLQIVLKLQDQASRELRRVTAELDGTQASTGRLGSSLEGLASMAKTAAFAVGAAAFAGASYGVTIAAQLETAQVGITTLLGSAEEGARTMDRIRREAARTPFELPGLTQAVQLLASVTHDGDKAIDVIMDIGEALAAMGKGQAELDRIIVNLQQIAAVGHAASIDIKQFAFAGIPIYEMLTKQTGLAGDALDKFISDGKVTFDLLTNMFDKANDEGGRFFNAFQNQSGTFNQALSNMKDSIGLFLADLVIATGVFGGVTQAMIIASSWLGQWQTHVAEAQAAITSFMATLEEHTGIVTTVKDAWALLSETYTLLVQPALADLMVALEPFIPVLARIGELAGLIIVSAFGQWIERTAQLLSMLMELSAWIVTNLTPAIKAIGETIQIVVGQVERLINALSKLTGVKASVGSIGSAAFGAASAFIPAIPFANGGVVTRPTLGLVGEAGPEAIIPLNKMRSMGGGNITVNVYGDVTGAELIEKVSEGIMASLRADSRFAV